MSLESIIIVVVIVNSIKCCSSLVTSGAAGCADRPLGTMAPDPADIDLEAMVIDALERLPEPFRANIGSVAIVIEDEATPA